MIPTLPDLRFCAVDAPALGLEGPRLSYMEAGQGAQTVLLLHGIGANSTGWRYILAGLADQARVIAWNAPGYFLSDPFLAEAPMPEAYGAVALALLDALGVAGRVHLVGSSFGSMLAAGMAARHPGRVASLAMLGTSRGQRWRTPAEREAMLAMRRDSIAQGGVALARDRSARLVAPGSSESVLRLVREMVAATDRRGLMAAAHCTDGVDLVADYAAAITAATLAITGTADAVNPAETVGRVVAAAIPGAVFLAPEGVGHLPELEVPGWTLEHLRRHILGA